MLGCWWAWLRLSAPLCASLRLPPPHPIPCEQPEFIPAYGTQAKYEFVERVRRIRGEVVDTPQKHEVAVEGAPPTASDALDCLMCGVAGRGVKRLTVSGCSHQIRTYAQRPHVFCQHVLTAWPALASSAHASSAHTAPIPDPTLASAPQAHYASWPLLSPEHTSHLPP